MSTFKNPNDPMRNRHGMVDIETLDTKISAAIISIGALIFDPHHLDTVQSIQKHKFYEIVNVDSCDKYGLTKSDDTIKWWEQQSDDARKALSLSLANKGSPLNHVMNRLRRFFDDSSAKPSLIWAKDPDFDCKILEYAGNKTEEKWPFMFFQGRSCRTVEDMAYPNGFIDKPNIRIGAHHNAYDDAVTQALFVQMSYMRLGLCQTWDPHFDKQMADYSARRWCAKCLDNLPTSKEVLAT